MERPKKIHKGIQLRKKMNVFILNMEEKEWYAEVAKIYMQNCKEKKTTLFQSHTSNWANPPVMLRD